MAIGDVQRDGAIEIYSTPGHQSFATKGTVVVDRSQVEHALRHGWKVERQSGGLFEVRRG